MIFTVYHTCEYRGNHEHLLKEGGVFADKKDLNLGKGYYYWEGDFDRAKDWGERHYRGNYYVFAGEFNFDLERMFDLTTNAHLKYIKAMTSRFRSDMKIGMFIDFVRSKQNEHVKNGLLHPDSLYFPFAYSKAIDNTRSIPVSNLELFSIRTGDYYHLKPKVYFCVYEKKDITLNSFKLVKTSGTIQNK